MNTQHYQIILSKHFMHSLFMAMNIAIMTGVPFSQKTAWMNLVMISILYVLLRSYHTMVYMLFGVPTGLRYELSAHLPIFYDGEGEEERKSFTFWALYQIFALFVCIDNVNQSLRVIWKDNSILENAGLTIIFWMILSIFAQKVGRISFACAMK